MLLSFVAMHSCMVVHGLVAFLERLVDDELAVAGLLVRLVLVGVLLGSEDSTLVIGGVRVVWPCFVQKRWLVRDVAAPKVHAWGCMALTRCGPSLLAWAEPACAKLCNWASNSFQLRGWR